MTPLLRSLAHAIFRIRTYSDRSIGRFAKGVHHKRILELGSGKLLHGKHEYSARRFFDASNEFIQSDIAKEHGHLIVDVTRMTFHSEFDVILCMSVLEHVYEHDESISNIYEALKPGGIAVIFVPAMYPLHDEPHDYWRFTEHSLRKLLMAFNDVRIQHKGPRAYPFAYYVEARK
jgi:2-polyprenyl-3-methyl-5-hydroxy-6-metoxy-1,4-benzoquinol methylase